MHTLGYLLHSSRLERKKKHTFITGAVCTLHEVTWQQHFVKVCEKAEVERKPNGLRHAYCTYHFAEHANENLTAQQAGNSPGMVHSHYKGLATKAEAKRWFAVKPPKSGKNVITLPVRKNAQ